jgi:hypothetical protein
MALHFVPPPTAGSSGCATFVTVFTMNKVGRFFQREWFLLITLTVIAALICLFEYFGL